MELWLTRAGSHGEFEQKFLDEGRIYLTWDELGEDLSKLDNRQSLLELLEQTYPNEKLKRLQEPQQPNLAIRQNDASR